MPMSILNRRRFCGLALTALAGSPRRCLAGPAQEHVAAAGRRFAESVGPHASLALRVLDTATGEVLYELNPDLSLTPASNMKLLTSAAALDRLGAGYRFETRLHAGSDGRLGLVGGGDPVLSDADLAALARAAATRGLPSTIEELLVDDYRYDAERLGIGWNSDDETFYYSAQVSALSVDRNVLLVDVRPAANPGEPATVDVPALPGFLQVGAAPLTGAAGSRERLVFERRRGRNELLVTGSLPAGSPGRLATPISIENPELAVGHRLARHLVAAGAPVPGSIRRAPVPSGWPVIARHVSPPLSEICGSLNKPSDNLIAELLLKEIGWVARGSGDASSGSDYVERWLAKIGIRATGVRINDGSGLSRQDLVTARAVSDLLQYARRQPWADVFVASLPVAGRDGTLRRRLTESPARDRVRAKTGSLSHVSALGGYLRTSADQELTFSALINNYPGPSAPCKAAEDTWVEALVSTPR